MAYVSDDVIMWLLYEMVMSETTQKKNRFQISRFGIFFGFVFNVHVLSIVALFYYWMLYKVVNVRVLFSDQITFLR